jgi:hypothetical protein
MDPIDQKTNHSYPNADREIGGTEQMPKSTPPESYSNVMPKNTSPEDQKPLVHFSDVMSSEPKVDNTAYKTSTVHTFKDDMANEASKGNFSIGKIMVANSKKIHGEQNTGTEIDKKNSHLALKILIPVVCVIIISIFSYIGFKSAKTPQKVSQLENPTQQNAGGILYSEQAFAINTAGKNRSAIYVEIAKETSATKIPVGKIKSVVFNKQSGTSTVYLSASEFLDIIAPSAPGLLLRNLKNEYVFGYYSYESNEPFLILKASNYDSVFAGMLDWERSIYADLGDLIVKPESLSKINTASSSTSTSPTSEYDTPFVDRIISNNDTRVLYRPNGNIAFFYTFFNKETVIIATSEQTLREIIYRMTSGKITR